MTNRLNRMNEVSSPLRWCRKRCWPLAFVIDPRWLISQGRFFCNLDGSGFFNSLPAHLAHNRRRGRNGRCRTCSLTRDPLGGVNIQVLNACPLGNGHRYPCKSCSPSCQRLTDRSTRQRPKGSSPRHRLEPRHPAALGSVLLDLGANPDPPFSGLLARIS